MVIYRVDYEQRKMNEQITVPKHTSTWKVKANTKVNNNNYIEYVHVHAKCSIGLP